jgi:hypothetical protein
VKTLQDLLSRHDATEGKKVMVQCFVTEEKKGDETLDIVL